VFYVPELTWTDVFYVPELTWTDVFYVPELTWTDVFYVPELSIRVCCLLLRCGFLMGESFAVQLILKLYTRGLCYLS